MKEIFVSKWDHTPLGIVIKLAVIIMATEYFIMFFIEYLLLPELGDKAAQAYWVYLDVFLLGTILTPVLYVLVLRPMNAQQMLLKMKNNELTNAAAKLQVEEAQVIAAHQRELETRERMIQIEKLSSMGTMVGGVAHEINNPLMGILNYVEYAKDKATDSRSKEVLEDALHEINRIKTIVRNMLVFIRADNSHKESCDVEQTAKQTLALLEGELRRNSVQVGMQLADALPPVKCSAGSLQQVLLNLLLNARDAIAEQTE
ncbi:MAG: histidine kinase dimerization/phospho-acceptor domain-containing protein, partial [Pseudomonadota bacterium]